MSTQIQCGSHQIHTVCNEHRSAKIKYKTKRNTRETAQRIRHTSVRFELHAPIYERKTKRSNAVFIEMRRTVSHFFRFVGNAVSLKIEWMRICLRFYRSRSQQALNGVGNWTERNEKKNPILLPDIRSMHWEQNTSLCGMHWIHMGCLRSCHPAEAHISQENR